MMAKSLLSLFLVVSAVLIAVTVDAQRFSLRRQEYPNHGLVLIDEIGVTDSTDDNGLNCVSDLTDCCSDGLRGEFDFPDGSTVPILGNIRNGYYRTRSSDRIILNRRPEGTAQGLFQCRIRTTASQAAYEEFYIGVYDENSGVPTVNDVSTSGLSITCMSSGGPATTVTWRRNCAVLPNNATYQQTQTVTVTQTASYRNVLVIDSTVTDTDGVYTCSVTNTRGYNSGVIGMGAFYDQNLPVIVTVTPSSDSPVAGGSFTLTCDHGSTASNPTYQWFDDAGNEVDNQATLMLNPLRESHGGEYSCLITDQSDGLVGCGVHRVSVQAPSVTVSVGGLTDVLAGTSQIITCSVSGFDISAAAVTSVMYTWLRGSTVVQSASTSDRYTIPSGSLMVTNSGDVYTCEVAITASYWDVSGSFGNSDSGTLTIIIPNPTIEITEIPLETEYVGLNYTLRCEAQVPGSQLDDIGADIEWMKNGIKLSDSNDRITLGDTIVDSPGREFRRSIVFTPLSASDMGSYRCSATISPTVDNPGVTNGVGIRSSNLTVAVPTLEVSIDRAGVPLRILDISPFNGFLLTCIATSIASGEPVSTRKRITWMRSVNNGPSEQLTNGANVDSIVTIMEDDLPQAASMSMLMVNTTRSGSHSYNCGAELVVAPAPEVINEQNETTISVAGPSPPVEPTNLMAVDITQNSATIRWTVPSLSYDLETYVVQYGLAMDSLTMTSSMVMGDVTPLNYMDDFQGSVTLTGLTQLTPYYYQVIATNNGGAFTTLSTVNTFNTSAQAPEPPTMLQCSQAPSDPLSYSCNWMAPAVTNGELTGYELECMPKLGGIPPPPVATSSMTSATVSGLRNGVNYTCTVRARNAGGLSMASAPTSFYTMEIAPSGPPLEVMVFPINKTRAIEFTWLPPAPTRRNGLITGYSLTCFITETGMGQVSDIYTPLEPPQRYRLEEFKPATEYTCRVVAMNSVSSGPPAEETFMTPEAAPDSPPLNITFNVLDPNSVEFSWAPPPEELSNGIIAGYRISCVVVGNQMGEPITDTLGDVFTMTTLQEFMPATRYNCSLAARTSAGIGLNGTLIVLTMPDHPEILRVATETRSLQAEWTYSNPPEGAVIDGYRIYIDGLLSQDTNSATQSVSIEGLTPFTNYTVEVSAFNTLGDGTVQEGPRSDPVTNMTLADVPGPPVCPQRWVEASETALTVNWTTPPNPNGIISTYYVQLLSFDNQTVISEADLDDLANLRADFRSLTLAEGVPYNVRVFAENGVGNGTFCIITDFGNEGPPGTALARNINITRIGGGEAARLTWPVLSLNIVKGHVHFMITYTQSGVSKRQAPVGCSQSGCSVPYEQGGVTVDGLNPDLPVTFNIMAVNEEDEQAAVVSLISQPLPDPTTSPPTTSPSTSPPAESGLPIFVFIIIGVVVLLIVVVVIIVIIVIVMRSRRKSKRLYSPQHGSTTSARHPSIEMDDKKKIEEEEAIRMSHRSTSPLTPTDKSQSPIASPDLYEGDRLQPVEIEYFSEHVKNMHENRDKRFEREYQTLPNDESVPATAANKNKSKNRFANISPYDFSRVKLSEIHGVEGSDYINASYIDGYDRPNAYIAAQGPMPNTIGDFWRMIWEHRLSTIVMLTKVTEGGKRKCEHYWPDNVHDTYQPPETTLLVSFEEILPFADYEIKKLVVTNPADPQSSPLTISHYHFLGWPDHGVPPFATALIGFIRRVRSKYNKSSPPMMVHCSAGVGRTGTFIVIDSLLERMEKEKTVNVYEFLTNMRRKRIQMVQTQGQYVFIHDALEELITCGDTAILSHNLRHDIGKLGKIVPEKFITGFQNQFELLGSVSRQPTDKDRSDALQHYNSAKNRYQDRLPFNTNRARLRPTGTPGADYVNASFIDGYKKRNAYIAAQAPLPNTVGDFWRMIWEFKSKCIVMLCDLTEGGKETCHPYWPTSIESTAQYGKLLVTLKSEKEDDNQEFIIRKFEITEEKTQSAFGNDKNIASFMVTQFQFFGWPELGRPDASQGVLQMAESVNAVQRSTGNKPITVICNDGIGRTGTFICIHAQLERVKTEGMIDVFQFVKSSRISRPNLVSELEYYIYCHHTLADFLDTFETYANFKDLGTANL